ncbi:hypothetical protein B0H14DRAFT_2616479 [Mycena olivaceomarginata]|nr:hypothetical protein B0H14DRAFT_2616479 [Mycena olivaceomarginata]
MSEKSHSTCNGMVQHVTLGRLWSASKVWRRDLKPVSSCLKALCEFQAVPSRPKLWGPCEKPSAGLHQGPGPSYLIANNDYYNKAVICGEEREHKNFVTFRESSQKVLEPLAWLGSGWRILDLTGPNASYLKNGKTSELLVFIFGFLGEFRAKINPGSKILIPVHP